MDKPTLHTHTPTHTHPYADKKTKSHHFLSYVLQGISLHWLFRHTGVYDHEVTLSTTTHLSWTRVGQPISHAFVISWFLPEIMSRWYGRWSLPLLWWWVFPHPRRFFLHLPHPTPVFHQYPASTWSSCYGLPHPSQKMVLVVLPHPRWISGRLPPPSPDFGQHPASQMDCPPTPHQKIGIFKQVWESLGKTAYVFEYLL